MSALSEIRDWIDIAELALDDASESAQSNRIELDDLPDKIESARKMVRSIRWDIEKMWLAQSEVQP